jgi:hypothetical protein
MRYTVFRDDDISVTTDIGLLMKAHEIITSHGREHTVAVLMDGLWDNKEVWLWLMTAKNLRVGLHGWTHRDYGKESRGVCLAVITRSIHYWNSHAGAYRDAPKITTFYPPWNRTGPELEAACAEVGLTVSTDWKKSSNVFGFHSWELVLPERVADLERALEA